jgi:hypothetical protein
MSDVAAILAFLILPLIGVAVWRLPAVAALSLDGRLAVAGAAGALMTAATMALLSVVHIEWSRLKLGLVLGVLVVLSVRGLRLTRAQTVRPSLALIAGCLFTLLTLYALLSARNTIGDLPFFWAPKGVHFYRLGGIDVDYLRHPDHFLQHRDYPPFLPLLYSWSNSWSGSFGWWGALFLSGLCFAGTVAVIRSFSRDDLSALLAASVLAWAFACTVVGGGADPLLVFYEVLAVSALVFLRDDRSRIVVAAIALGAVAVAKLEGAAFVVAVAAALLLVERVRFRRLAAIVAPAVLLLGGWLTFIARAELFDTYGGAKVLALHHFSIVCGSVFRMASYDAWYLPWIAPIVVVLLGDVRRARLPILVAMLTLAATLFFYLHGKDDPTIFWIPSSARRVLMTPLMMLVVAAAAAHAKPELPAPHEAKRGVD